MTAAIYIYYTPDWQPLADIVLPKVKSYCDKWGHGHYIELGYSASGHNGYSKMMGVDDMMTRYDFIWVLDLDTLITNPFIDFMDFTDNEHDIFICKDVNGLNAGSWIIRNTAASKAFVETIINNFDAPHEQIMMNRYIDMVKVKYLPHPSINSYDYNAYTNDWCNLIGNHIPFPDHEGGQWQPGDLLLHLPGLSMETRIKIFKSLI